jgi:hypothetical protein
MATGYSRVEVALQVHIAKRRRRPPWGVFGNAAIGVPGLLEASGYVDVALGVDSPCLHARIFIRQNAEMARRREIALKVLAAQIMPTRVLSSPRSLAANPLLGGRPRRVSLSRNGEASEPASGAEVQDRQPLFHRYFVPSGPISRSRGGGRRSQ